MEIKRILTAALISISGHAMAGVSIDLPGVHIRNEASSESGVIGPDVEMEGVAIINGEVFVDGIKVPKGTTSYKSKKSGKIYLIHWGKDGNVSVTEKQ